MQDNGSPSHKKDQKGPWDQIRNITPITEQVSKEFQLIYWACNAIQTKRSVHLQVEWHDRFDGTLTRIKNMPTKAPTSPPPNAVITNFNISRGFLGEATVTPPLQNHPYNVSLHSYITKAFKDMPLCSSTQTCHHPLSSTVILGPLLCRRNVKEAKQNTLKIQFCITFLTHGIGTHLFILALRCSLLDFEVSFRNQASSTDSEESHQEI